MFTRLTVFSLSLILLTSSLSIADPVRVPLYMSIPGETRQNNHAEFLFEADGPGMLSVVIRANNDVAFSVRAQGGEGVIGQFDIDYKGDTGAEQAIVPLPGEGNYIIEVRPLNALAEFILAASWLPFDEASSSNSNTSEGQGNNYSPNLAQQSLPYYLLEDTIVIEDAIEIEGAVQSYPVVETSLLEGNSPEDAVPVELGMQIAGAINPQEGMNHQWYSFESYEKGILFFIVHNASQDMVVQGFKGEEASIEFARSDEDFGGNGGNEVIMAAIEEGETYYFKVSSYTSGEHIDFNVLSEIFPDAVLGSSPPVDIYPEFPNLDSPEDNQDENDEEIIPFNEGLPFVPAIDSTNDSVEIQNQDHAEPTRCVPGHEGLTSEVDLYEAAAAEVAIQFTEDQLNLGPAETANSVELGFQVSGTIDAESQKWYSFEAFEDGILLFVVHNCTTDMTIEAYNSEDLTTHFARSDEDFAGSQGNEIILMPMKEGETYYFKVAPLNHGNGAEYSVICEIFPDAVLSYPHQNGDAASPPNLHHEPPFPIEFDLEAVPFTDEIEGVDPFGGVDPFAPAP